MLLSALADNVSELVMGNIIGIVALVAPILVTAEFLKFYFVLMLAALFLSIRSVFFRENITQI